MLSILQRDNGALLYARDLQGASASPCLFAVGARTVELVDPRTMWKGAENVLTHGAGGHIMSSQVYKGGWGQSMLATGSSDGIVCMWDYRGGTASGSFAAQTSVLTWVSSQCANQVATTADASWQNRTAGRIEGLIVDC